MAHVTTGKTPEGSALVEKLRPGAQERCNERAESPELEQPRKTDAQPVLREVLYLGGIWWDTGNRTPTTAGWGNMVFPYAISPLLNV